MSACVCVGDAFAWRSRAAVSLHGRHLDKADTRPCAQGWPALFGSIPAERGQLLLRQAAREAARNRQGAGGLTETRGALLANYLHSKRRISVKISALGRGGGGCWMCIQAGGKGYAGCGTGVGLWANSISDINRVLFCWIGRGKVRQLPDVAVLSQSITALDCCQACICNWGNDTGGGALHAASSDSEDIPFLYISTSHKRRNQHVHSDTGVAQCPRSVMPRLSGLPKNKVLVNILSPPRRDSASKFLPQTLTHVHVILSLCSRLWTPDSLTNCTLPMTPERYRDLGVYSNSNSGGVIEDMI